MLAILIWSQEYDFLYPIFPREALDKRPHKLPLRFSLFTSVPLDNTMQAGILKILKIINKNMYDFKLRRNNEEPIPMFLLNSLIFFYNKKSQRHFLHFL